MRSYVSHLESAVDGTRFEFGKVWTTHKDRPLWVAYDLKKLRRGYPRKELLKLAPDMWRYRAVLPVGPQVISIGEVMTPLLPCPRLAAELGMKQLFIKDESRLPTGSFKARGMAVAITMACALRIPRVAIPTAGNAGGAAAAYAARAGLECHVFMPVDSPEVNRTEAALFGARVTLVEGQIDDCAAIVRDGAKRKGWFDLSTLREPYRLEGKKTMGYELAEQCGWRLPKAIFYPTGGGTGLIGMWKAFQELAELRWVEPGPPPKMFACQAAGCAPLKPAFDTGQRFGVPVRDPHTIASGLRVPKAIGDFMILDTVRASGGAVMTAGDEEAIDWMYRACALEGISLCPEAAVCLVVLEQALRNGKIKPDESAVIFNTAAAQKYVEVLRRDFPIVTPGAVDWSLLT